MFHVVSWVSSWFVFVLFGLGVGCWFVVLCVCVVLKTLSFLLSPILQHEGIAIQRQNVFMTVRASSAHGMSSKKKVVALLSLLSSDETWNVSHCLTPMPLHVQGNTYMVRIGWATSLLLFCGVNRIRRFSVFSDYFHSFYIVFRV